MRRAVEPERFEELPPLLALVPPRERVPLVPEELFDWLPPERRVEPLDREELDFDVPREREELLFDEPLELEDLDFGFEEPLERDELDFGFGFDEPAVRLERDAEVAALRERCPSSASSSSASSPSSSSGRSISE